MSLYDEDDLEPPEDYEPGAYSEPQPDMFCECRPSIEIRQRWQHAPGCLHWAPPMTGSGSTAQHRAAAMAHIRAQIADAKRRHQETT